jgi:hypothetical protein
MGKDGRSSRQAGWRSAGEEDGVKSIAGDGLVPGESTLLKAAQNKR